MQKIHLAIGDMGRYFGEISLHSIPVEWLLAVSPEEVVEASSPDPCTDCCERAHRIRLVQLHACAFGLHAPVAFEMSLI